MNNKIFRVELPVTLSQGLLIQTIILLTQKAHIKFSRDVFFFLFFLVKKHIFYEIVKEANAQNIKKPKPKQRQANIKRIQQR